MQGVSLAIATFLYVFNVTMAPILHGDILTVNGTVHELSGYYFPNCTLYLVLYNKEHLITKEVNLANIFYYSVQNFSVDFNLSYLPSGNYTISYYIKCGKIHYIPGVNSIHLSFNPLYSLTSLGEGVFYNFVWNNPKKTDTAYIDKSKFDLSGSTGTYAPLVYGDKISFTVYLNKKARLIIKQCSINSCYELYDKIVGPGYVKEFLSLKEKKPGEIYWIKFFVIDLDVQKVTDYFENPIVIPGDTPNLILIYLDENTTHLLFKPIDPNLKTIPTTYTLVLDNYEKSINLPQITREEIYDLKISGIFSKVCVKELNECYYFDKEKYLTRIEKIDKIMKKYLFSQKTNNTSHNITETPRTEKEKKHPEINKIILVGLLVGVLILGSIVIIRKIRS